jgi:hypothetical protein
MFEDINHILNRNKIYESIKNELDFFEKNKEKIDINRGFYIYGNSGVGKTKFIINLLNDLNYKIIKYDAGDIRNKTVIETISKNNMTDKSVVSMFNNNPKKIAIIMDEIDGMNNGDKGGINALIKLLRAKKTKKQKLEDTTSIPIICISDYHNDKKIRELIKVCKNYELLTPTTDQIKTLLKKQKIKSTEIILNFIDNDLKKLEYFYKIYQTNQFENIEPILNKFQSKKNNNDTNKIIKDLFTNLQYIYNHNLLISETDRTIIGLLFHENVINILDKKSAQDTIIFYKNILDNICFSDYIDRITFQKQIWKFNEMSSLIKTFYNNSLLINNNYKYQKEPIRFTKVLTKYSTEYNNQLFIQGLCQQLNVDKKDLLLYFYKNSSEDEYFVKFLIENYEISKLEIDRLYRYLEKYM